MSSQPYVYKPPVRRGSQNPPTKSQILPQTTTNKPQGLKVTKLSDLGSSSLFKGLDNLSLPPQNKSRIQQVSKQKKEQIKQTVKDRSISGLNRYQRKQPNPIIQQPTITIQQPITRLKQTPKVIEKQIDTQSASYAPIIRKPIARTVKEQPKEQPTNKPNVITRQPLSRQTPQEQPKQQTQAVQKSSYSYKPALKRTSTPLNPFTSEIISRNQSAILTKQPLLPQSKDNISTSKSSQYERKRQRESSIIDLNLQVNTQTKIFKLQTKNDTQISSVQKIPTSKSISSSNNIISPVKSPNKQIKKQQTSVIENISIISQPKRYTYQRPKTKAQLVRENQLKTNENRQKDDQKVQQTKTQDMRTFYGQNRSTIIPKVEKVEIQHENKSTIIGDKQSKSYTYQYGRKTKQQLVEQNKAKQPHIIVSAQTFKNQDKKEDVKVQKPATKSYTYQPAYRRTQKPVQEPNISSQQQQKNQETEQNRSNLLIQSRKSQYPYQRKTVTQQRTQTSTQVVGKNATIKPYGVPYGRPSLVKEKQQAQAQQQSKKEIPLIGFSILNILVRKKMKGNLRQSLDRIHEQVQKSNKRQRCLQFFMKKSISLSGSYINNLKLQTFNQLKKNLILKLTQTQSISSNKIIGTRIAAKPKESKEDQQLKNITQTMKKPLCYRLNQLLNTKLKFVFKFKLYSSFNQSNYQSTKSPIFSTLFKLFSTQNHTQLQNSFYKLKFTHHHLQKTNNQDILPLFQTKKISKQQLIKFLQNIIPTQPIPTPTTRVSFLSKTPQKLNLNKKNELKIQNKKNLISPSSNVETQKVTSIKSKIQFLKKQLKQQQKINKDKQNEINQKKIELKKQIDEMKRQNQIRKKENQELKEKLKQFEVISFSDRKDARVSYELVTPNKQSSSLSNQKKPKTQNNEYLNVLCELYVRNILGNQQGIQSMNYESIETFLDGCQQINPMIVKSFDYLTKQRDSQEQEHDRELPQSLVRSKILIEERLLVEQNILLKSQIDVIECKMIGQSVKNQEQEGFIKSVEQIEAMRCLVRNYIKQRYLWQWIKKQIQKI